MIKGDKIKLVKPMGAFTNVGEVCEITNITEDGTIWFRFGGSHLGCMSYDELERYFEKYVDNEPCVSSTNSKIKASIEWNFFTDGDYTFQKRNNGYDYGKIEDSYEYHGRAHFTDYIEAQEFLEEMLCNAAVSPAHYYLIKKFYNMFDSLIRFINYKQKGQCREEMSGNYDDTFIEVTIW